MRIDYHPLVKRDLRQIVEFLDSESIFARAKFEAEFERSVLKLAAQPTLNSPYLGSPIFRRAKVPSFPHLIIYRIVPSGVRITVVKHEKRHPRYGMSRW